MVTLKVPRYCNMCRHLPSERPVRLYVMVRHLGRWRGRQRALHKRGFVGISRGAGKSDTRAELHVELTGSLGTIEENGLG